MTPIGPSSERSSYDCRLHNPSHLQLPVDWISNRHRSVHERAQEAEVIIFEVTAQDPNVGKFIFEAIVVGVILWGLVTLLNM